MKRCNLFNRRGQHMAEYAIVFAIVIGAAVAMQPLVKRALQARVHDATHALVGASSGTVGGGSAPSGTLNKTWQYEPYYAQSSRETTTRASNMTETRTGNQTKRTEDSTAAAGAESQDTLAADKSTEDDAWTQNFTDQ